MYSDWILMADLLQKSLHGPVRAPALVCCHPKQGLAWKFLLPQMIFKLCKQVIMRDFHMHRLKAIFLLAMEE